MTSSGHPFGGRRRLHAAPLPQGITNQEMKWPFLNIMMIVIFGIIFVLSHLSYCIVELKLKHERAMVLSSPVEPQHISTISRSNALQIVPILDRRKQANNVHGKNAEEGEINGNPSSICVVVRTFVGHGRMLQVQLSAWEAIGETIEVSASEDAAKERDIQIILANTDAKYTDRETFAFFHDTLRLVNVNYNGRNVVENKRPSKVSYHIVVLPEEMTPDKSLFGFDVTQLILDELLSNTAHHNIQCNQLIFTKGNSYYHREILQKTGLNKGVKKLPQESSTTSETASAAAEAQLIGFDFISHNFVVNRWSRKGHQRTGYNQQIEAEFEHSIIDLGAAFVAADAIRNCEDANFKAFGKNETFGRNWTRNAALDWFFFESLLICGVKMFITHEVLLVQQ